MNFQHKEESARSIASASGISVKWLRGRQQRLLRTCARHETFCLVLLQENAKGAKIKAVIGIIAAKLFRSSAPTGAQCSDSSGLEFYSTN